MRGPIASAFRLQMLGAVCGPPLSPSRQGTISHDFERHQTSHSACLGLASFLLRNRQCGGATGRLNHFTLRCPAQLPDGGRPSASVGEFRPRPLFPPHASEPPHPQRTKASGGAHRHKIHRHIARSLRCISNTYTEYLIRQAVQKSNIFLVLTGLYFLFCSAFLDCRIYIFAL